MTKKKNTKPPRRPQLVEPSRNNRMVLRKELSLKSWDAQKLINLLAPVCFAFIRIGVILQRYAEEIRIISLLQTLNEEILIPLRKDLQAECDRLNLLISEHGIKKEGGCYKEPVIVTIEISHPFGQDFVDMVEKLDELQILRGYLYYGKIINDVQYKKDLSKWRDVVWEAGTRICRLSKETLNQAQQEEKEKAAIAAKGEETSTASASTPPDSQSTGPLEPVVPETSETQEIGPGVNVRKPRKVAKISSLAPETEEDQAKSLGASGPLEPSGPEETVAAVQ